MAKQTSAKAADKTNNFKPTFRKFDSMTDGEKDAFRQGAKTVANRVKENLGLKQKREDR